jgi:hypothetical protein
VVTAGLKPELGQSSRNKILLNFIWNLIFWQTLEICTTRFRRDFDMEIFPKIFYVIQEFKKNVK